MTTNPQGPGDRDPIAIVGVACRLPGAADPDAFWRLLVEERDCVTEIPPERFDVDPFYDPAPGTARRIVSRAGGFLTDFDRFDAAFFRISPDEAERLDPMHRILMETTWEALEDAGIPAQDLAESRTGVYTSTPPSEYWEMVRRTGVFDAHAAVGGTWGIPASRIAYQFDLRGPSLGVEGACAASLLSVHLACRALWSGEIDQAIVGAANMLLAPDMYFPLSEAQMLSPGGRCRFGNADADGYVRSEGNVAVILKPLSAALADGNPVHAMILGSAATSTGRSGGSPMAPGVAGQEDMLRTAYRDAGVRATDIDYVEAHGAGTALGDEVEFTALSNVLGEDRPADRPCLVGSVKTNIGHTEIAAGLAGLLKVVLSLRHRTVPASLHVRSHNPILTRPDTPLALADRSSAWPDSGRRPLAGVSAFGVTGLNVHLVVTEPPARQPTASVPQGDEPGGYLLPLSARDPAALSAAAGRYAEALARGVATSSLRDLCFSAGAHRTHLDYRTALTAPNRIQLVTALRAMAAGRRRPELPEISRQPATTPRVAFVFPGQGGHWLGMGRELLDTDPVFAARMTECAAAVEAELGWSPVDRLRDDTPLTAVDEIQPVLWAFQVSLAAVWRDWGVEPDLLIGHSMGEIAAATVAGALTLAQGAAVVCRRSVIVGDAAEPGTMWAVQLDESAAQEAIGDRADLVSVGVVNSPYSIVLSGEEAALREVVEPLRRSGVFCRQVPVDYASHSPRVASVCPPLLDALADLAPVAGRVPIHSTVIDRRVDGSRFDAGYWADNLRGPVRFDAAVRSAVADGERTVFIEMSPHPLLCSAIEDTVEGSAGAAIAVGSLHHGRSECTSLRAALGAVYSFGVDVDWRRVYPGARYAPLPTYPWQRRRYWIGGTTAATDEAPAASRAKAAVPAEPATAALPAEPATAALPAEPATAVQPTEPATAALPAVAAPAVADAAVGRIRPAGRGPAAQMPTPSLHAVPEQARPAPVTDVVPAPQHLTAQHLTAQQLAPQQLPPHVLPQQHGEQQPGTAHPAAQHALPVAAGGSAAALTRYLVDHAAMLMAIRPEEIQPCAPLTLAGLDSLLATKLRTQISADFGVTMHPRELLASKAVTEIAAEILRRAASAGAAPAGLEPIGAMPRQYRSPDPYPLSATS